MRGLSHLRTGWNQRRGPSRSKSSHASNKLDHRLHPVKSPFCHLMQTRMAQSNSYSVTPRRGNYACPDAFSAEVCCIGGVFARTPSHQAALSRLDTSRGSIRRDDRSHTLAVRAGPSSQPQLSYPPLRPASSGKSSLIRHLSQLLKGAESPRHRATSSLSSSRSVRHRCKAAPRLLRLQSHRAGKFEWTEGALTRAVRQGKWVVLEDIDKAGSEVLSTVARVVEQLGPTKLRALALLFGLGTRGKIAAGDGFCSLRHKVHRISARHASSPSSPPSLAARTGPRCLSSRQPVGCQQHSQEQVPRLAQQQSRFVDRLVATWYKLQRATQPSAASTQANTKVWGLWLEASVRHTARFIKWRRRVERLLSSELEMLADPSTIQCNRKRSFIEACDIFLGSVPEAQNVSGMPAQTSKSVNGKSADRYSALSNFSLRARPDQRASVVGPQATHPRALGQIGRGAVARRRCSSARRRGFQLIRVGRCELMRRSKSHRKACRARLEKVRHDQAIFASAREADRGHRPRRARPAGR